MTLPNYTDLRRLGQAAAGGVGSATGVAAMYAAATTGLDNRPPLLSLETIATISAIHSGGADLVRGAQAPHAAENARLAAAVHRRRDRHLHRLGFLNLHRPTDS